MQTHLREDFRKTSRILCINKNFLKHEFNLKKYEIYSKILILQMIKYVLNTIK
jgi:hypothetical protein